MTDFLNFNPISKEFRDDFVNYYNTNNIDIPDHPIIKEFFAAPRNEISTKSNKVVHHPIRHTVIQKKAAPVNYPDFSLQQDSEAPGQSLDK